MLACVLDALNNGTTEARGLAAAITARQLVLAWTCPGLPWHPMANVGQLAALTDALGAQAFAYADAGLHVSTSDCYWLVAKLRGGALQIVTAERVAVARDRAEGLAIEAEASRRRGRDLKRWQQDAKARAGFR